MSSKPTRSEIENALASGQPQTRRESQKSPTARHLLLESGRRRQQVIGGDLSGVASRRSNQGLAWLRRINLVNWIAAAIVALILLAFFWPNQDKGTIREIAERENTVKSEPFYSESRVDQPVEEVAQKQTYNRPDDIQRADEYRSQDAMDRRIRELLALAKQQIAEGRYTLPAGNNASNTYNQILLLNKNNVQAEQGLDYIRGRFLATGLAALKKNQLTAAQSALSRLMKIDGESEEYSELLAAVENWKQDTKIRSLLNKAEAARAEDKLILPARDNALYHLQQVLELDPNHQPALNGIQQIADSYIEKANQAIAVGAYQSAAGYLATASVIDSEHPSLPLMEELLAKAKPLAAQRNANQQGNAPAGTQPDTSRSTPNAESNDSQAANATDNQRSMAGEQKTIDDQLLTQGLDAYYKGDYETAAAMLQPLADKGISRAQFRIGYMYFLGRGFDTDRSTADSIIRAALPAVQKFADEGRAWAQSDIGSLYEDGLVLPRDYGEAVYWYRSAAEQGYPGAQTNLGIMYARGRGVSSSRRTAIEWFQRAAKQGDESAKRNLESMGITP